MSPSAIGGIAGGVVGGVIVLGLLLFYCLRCIPGAPRQNELTPPPSPKPREPNLDRIVSINSFDSEDLARMSRAMEQSGTDGTHRLIYPVETDEIGGRLGTIHEKSGHEESRQEL